MPAKHKRIVIYPDDVALAEWSAIKAYYQSKAGEDVIVTDGYVGRELIHQKAVDIENQKTKGLTIQQIHILLQQMFAEIKAIREDRTNVQ